VASVAQAQLQSICPGAGDAPARTAVRRNGAVRLYHQYVELSHGIDMGLRGLRHIEPLNESFLKFFPHNLTLLRQITWSHLWFLAYLFLYTVFLLPLLVRLARCAPRAVEPAALTVYLPAIPMALLLVATNGYWPFLPNLITDWPNCSFYALCFVIGAGITVWPGLRGTSEQEAPRLFVFMLLAFAGMDLQRRVRSRTPVRCADRVGRHRSWVGFRISSQTSRDAGHYVSDRGDDARFHRAPCPATAARRSVAADGAARVAQDRVDLDSGHGDFARGLSLADPTLATGALVNGNGQQPGDHPQRSCLKVNRAGE